jgi:hypothetical protein
MMIDLSLSHFVQLIITHWELYANDESFLILLSFSPIFTSNSAIAQKGEPTATASEFTSELHIFIFAPAKKRRESLTANSIIIFYNVGGKNFHYYVINSFSHSRVTTSSQIQIIHNIKTSLTFTHMNWIINFCIRIKWFFSYCYTAYSLCHDREMTMMMIIRILLIASALQLNKAQQQSIQFSTRSSRAIVMQMMKVLSRVVLFSVQHKRRRRFVLDTKKAGISRSTRFTRTGRFSSAVTRSLSSAAVCVCCVSADERRQLACAMSWAFGASAVIPCLDPEREGDWKTFAVVIYAGLTVSAAADDNVANGIRLAGSLLRVQHAGRRIHHRKSHLDRVE